MVETVSLAVIVVLVAFGLVYGVVGDVVWAVRCACTKVGNWLIEKVRQVRRA